MKCWIPAPDNNNQNANGAVLGVSVNDDEYVEWVYTILPDGRKIVTGYNLRPLLPDSSENDPK